MNADFDLTKRKNKQRKADFPSVSDHYTDV